MWPDWSVGTWSLVIGVGNVVYIAGLISLWPIMTYFCGSRVGWGSFLIAGIPIWAEVIGLWLAFCIVAIAVGIVLLALCVAFFIICGVFWVLSWPWRYRYRRLFREHLGFDSKVARGASFVSKWQRRVDRRLKELAIALQDALDRRAAAGDGSDTWELNRAVNRARKSFRLAQKAARECQFSVKRSHEYYLPKRRREKILKACHLQLVG